MINTTLPTIYPTYLFFSFYGAALLIMSFAIGTKNMTGSRLRIVRSLWLLAIFGLAHGVHKWFEFYSLMEHAHLQPQVITSIDYISTVLMIVSYLFLLQFGLSLSHESSHKRMKLTAVTYSVLCAIFILSAVIAIRRHDLITTSHMLEHVQFAANDSIGFFAGLISAYGLIKYSRRIKPLSDSASRHFSRGGSTFILYGLFTSALFSKFTDDSLGITSEVFRGISVVIITYFIIRALNIFDVEMRERIMKQERRLAQSDKLISLGHLAAGVAHEMNNPLTNASLGIQLLKKKLANGEQGVFDRLNAVEKNIDCAATISQGLLQFSRNRVTDFIPLDINEVIISTLSLLKFKLDNIEIEQSLAQVPYVMGDSIRLQQVIINVLCNACNAVEAMPAGGRIRISTSSLGNGMVEVRITDTGIGIAEEKMLRIFDPFYTTDEVGNGTGLGLPISYGIIKEHLGDIKISSTVGQGTMVAIEIPEA